MIEADVVGVTIDRGQHTVLVVDDNPATRYATARVLRAAGFKTVEAENGQEALRLADGSVSAVVLDVHLPDMSGFVVCQRLREQPQTAVLPVIHLSATFVEDRHKVEGLNAGADAYITHPAEPPILIATVQALVRARMAEERLRNSESKFRAIYTQAESGIALLDSEGRFSDANPAMLRMLGRSADQVLQHFVSDFAPPDLKDLVARKTRNGLDAGGLLREAFPLLDANGGAVHFEWSISSSLEPGLRVAVATNVSDRRELELRRQELLEREHAARLSAERYSQTKDDFIAVLSHELRNPLNAMMMAVHVLLVKGVPPEIERSLAVIQKNAKTQARIIADLLDVSRINSGKLTLNRELSDPSALIAASVEGMQPAISQKQLRVVLDLPADEAPAWIDPVRFQQVFWNIFANAVKFSPPGAEIRVAVGRPGDRLRLAVQDFGEGMEPQFIHTIFDKFSQVVSRDDGSRGGLGLGMSIVKHLVDLHSGTVVVESAGPGLGTTVTVEMPVMPRVPPDSGTDDQDADGVDGGSSLRGLRILIVEDDPQALEMLSVILRERGAHVVAAGDYDSALVTMAAGQRDVLVADIGLPGKDGYELMREVRAMEKRSSPGKRLLSIALTAFGRPQDRAMAMEAGFDLHIAKPLRPLELISAIDQRRGR